MQQITVWAPRPQNVELVFQSHRIPMTPVQGGWWTALCHATDGSDYQFVLDGGDPVPDPRSPWQPRGVHGPSRALDHSRFRWTDAKWQPPPLASGIFYELHIGTFTPEGTFDSAVARIPHLRELGVTHVELMPVAEFPGERGWGYDGVDLYAPHHAYGGPYGLKRLVDALHANGLAAILDVVYNHLGPSGNYISRFGPYFNDRLHTPWGAAVNLNEAGSDEVRRFFLDNAVMWLRDYHFDGLRLDAVHALIDPSATHLLEELAGRVELLESELGRRLVVIAESDLNDPRLVRSREAGGYGLAAQWSDDFHHAIHTLLTGERDGYYADFGSLGDLAKALAHGFVYDGCYSAFRGHRHGRPLEGIPKTRLLGYAQNHDQVGNRARGERLGALVVPERLKMAAALVLLAPFVPLLFQGEEWGASTPFLYFTDHREPELARAVSEGRRREFARFGWDPASIPDPQDPATFQRSKLDWSEPDREPHRGLLDWYRRLIALRAGLAGEEAGVACDEAAGWLRLDRGGVHALFNFGESATAVPCEDGAVPLLASRPGIAIAHGRACLPRGGVLVCASERSPLYAQTDRNQRPAGRSQASL